MVLRLAQVLLAFRLASSYKLKQNESLLDFPQCVGLPLQGAGGADDWQCDALSGTMGTVDEFKCTHRYDGGVEGKVYLQCQIHPRSDNRFNCLASKRCIPNGDAKVDGNQCHCDPATGSAATGEDCKVNFGYECGSCLPAFYLAEDKHCKRKLCTCAFGTASAGADCPSHATPHCSSCNVAGGYVMDVDGKTCIEKQCLCAEGTGTASKGTQCPVHNTQKCQSCATGFIFAKDAVTCKEKQCNCLLDGKRAGEGATGTSCDTDGMNKCASCDDAAGYAMDPAGGNTCIVKQCTCASGTGTAASGAACDVHQAKKCETCNTDGGFTLAADGRSCVCDTAKGYEAAGAGKCVYKKCTCSNGKKAKGTSCPKNGMAFCTSCDAGYRMEDNQCALNVCTCDHGTPVTGAACDVNKKHECSVCKDDNYELIDGKCVYKKCRCKHGTRAKGDECPKHKAKMCTACKAGFRFAPGKVRCLRNKCTCENGDPVKGADCKTHKDHKCATCKDAGYQMIDGKCEFKVCTCASGTRAEGASCPKMGKEKCVSCDAGYHVNDAGVCEVNSCSCSDGVAASGTDCDKHNEHKCASCDAGYQLIDKKCTFKVCKCSNGVKAEGEDCRCHNCKTCKSCDAGYRLKASGKDQVCRVNSCSCSNGVAATGASCKTHNSNTCASCNSGYDLSGSSCSLRTCTCQNGNGKTGTACPKQGQENCASCTTTGYELVSKDGRSECKNALADMQALLATKKNQERTAVAWGDPHIKVFDYQYKNKNERFTNFHRGWDHSNLNTMEPGTYWLIKTPDNMVSIQGVYGWGWRAVIRSVAISGGFINNDRIQVFPKRKTSIQKKIGVYYQKAGEKRKRLNKFNKNKKWTWKNHRKDVNIKWVYDRKGLSGNHQWRCKITLPLYVELILNIYNHHMDVVLTMRPIEGMWGDMGNINGNANDEMKWNPNIHQRNKYWYQMTTAHGTRVSKGENLFPYWYDVPKAPRGAKTSALLEVNKSSEETEAESEDLAEEADSVDEEEGEGEEEGEEEEEEEDEPGEVVVDGIELKERAGPKADRRHDCSEAEEKAATKLCHDMFKVNNSVEECIVDVCQQGPKMAQKAEVVEVEVEESEEEETVEHYKIYDGGRLYHSCFHAEEHFSKVAAMPRDTRELNLIKALATETTLLGARCAGQLWVYLDGTRVPEEVIGSGCSNGQLLCVQGDSIAACEGAKKIACQIPRLYTCKSEVTFEDINGCRAQERSRDGRSAESHGFGAVHHATSVERLRARTQRKT